MRGARRRRVVLLVSAAAAVAAIALPANAGAFFDHHFTVIGNNTHGHRTENGFAFRIEMLNPANPSNMVGHGHAECRGERGQKSHCSAVLHFDGTIGGFGDLFVKGNFGHGDHTLTVDDGDGDFTGRVAGKMVIHSISRRYDALHFDLTR